MTAAKDFITLGAYGDIAVDPKHIIKVEAVARLDRADQAILPPDGGSIITLSTGATFKVPESVDVVLEAVVATAEGQ